MGGANRDVVAGVGCSPSFFARLHVAERARGRRIATAFVIPAPVMVFANPEARSLLANRHRRSPCVLLRDTLDDPEQGSRCCSAERTSRCDTRNA